MLCLFAPPGKTKSRPAEVQRHDAETGLGRYSLSFGRTQAALVPVPFLPDLFLTSIGLSSESKNFPKINFII